MEARRPSRLMDCQVGGDARGYGELALSRVARCANVAEVAVGRVSLASQRHRFGTLSENKKPFHPLGSSLNDTCGRVARFAQTTHEHEIKKINQQMILKMHAFFFLTFLCVSNFLLAMIVKKRLVGGAALFTIMLGYFFRGKIVFKAQHLWPESKVEQRLRVHSFGFVPNSTLHT